MQLREATLGDLAEKGPRDLLQALEGGAESGLLRLSDRSGREGRVWLRGGRVIDAALEHKAGEAALYPMLRWTEGRFAFEPGSTDRPERIGLSTRALLLEGERRQAVFQGLARRFPPASTPLEIDYLLLSDRLAEIPDEMNGVLKLVDGRRTVEEILLESGLDDLVAASIVAKLLAEEIVRPVPAASASPGEAPGRARGEPSAEPAAWFTAPAAEGERPADGSRAQAGSGPRPPRVVRFPAPPRPSVARRPPLPIEPPAAPPPPSPDPPRPLPEGPRATVEEPARRERVPALAAALAVLLIVALALGVLLKHSGQKAPVAPPGPAAPARTPPLEPPGPAR